MLRDFIYYENLNVAIDLLAIKYPNINNDYERLKDLINEEFPVEFNGEVTVRDIWIAFEPDIPTDELDVRLQYNILFNE